MNLTPPARAAIDRRAAELSKIGARRYAAENRLLLYPDVSRSHSTQMDRISVRKEFRKKLQKNLEEINAEFDKTTNLPLEHWIDNV